MRALVSVGCLMKRMPSHTLISAPSGQVMTSSFAGEDADNHWPTVEPA